MATATVIGYGNELRGDKGAGRIVADQIALRGIPGVGTHVTRTLARGHVSLFDEVDIVVFVGTYDAHEGDPVRVERIQDENGGAATAFALNPPS
ncbi:hypothetical protein HN371_00390 [Candidatus Poribacteria bacterium]|nr:hypothetical protein [Candidatus Poribacteria bacterium]